MSTSRAEKARECHGGEYEARFIQPSLDVATAFAAKLTCCAVEHSQCVHPTSPSTVTDPHWSRTRLHRRARSLFAEAGNTSEHRIDVKALRERRDQSTSRIGRRGARTILRSSPVRSRIGYSLLACCSGGHQHTTIPPYKCLEPPTH